MFQDRKLDLLASVWKIFMWDLYCLRHHLLHNGSGQNRRWKLGQQTPYVGNHLAYFDNLLLFFKIGNWNFQHLFEKEFCETSQNFNSVSQWIEKMKTKFVWINWMSWHFARFHEILFLTGAESFRFRSWKTNKFYS